MGDCDDLHLKKTSRFSFTKTKHSTRKECSIDVIHNTYKKSDYRNQIFVSKNFVDARTEPKKVLSDARWEFDGFCGYIVFLPNKETQPTKRNGS